MADEVKMLGIAGSLRRQSYNRAALRAAINLVPSGVTLKTFDLDGIPPFNQDHEKSPLMQCESLGPLSRRLG